MKNPNQEIALRPWKEADRRPLIAFANNKKIFNNLTDAFPHPFTNDSATKFFAWANEHDPPLILAITLDDKPVGSIGLHPLKDVFRLNCELGYWVAEPYWGKGFATEAVRQMTRYAHDNFHFKRLFARPYGSNIASQKVLEKAGFKREAYIEQNIIKNNQLEDELIYAIRF